MLLRSIFSRSYYNPYFSLFLFLLVLSSHFLQRTSVFCIPPFMFVASVKTFHSRVSPSLSLLVPFPCSHPIFAPVDFKLKFRSSKAGNCLSGIWTKRTHRTSQRGSDWRRGDVHSHTVIKTFTNTCKRKIKMKIKTSYCVIPILLKICGNVYQKCFWCHILFIVFWLSPLPRLVAPSVALS